VTRQQRRGVLALACYIAGIVLANWAIKQYGFVPVGFGLVAPAGTYFAGAVFVARDVIQMTLGRRYVLAAIAAGALLSWQTSPTLAAASGIAFLVGEMADYAIYTPLADRGRIVLAVLVADTVGLLFDTFLFLHLAFGSVAHWQGTALGKEWMTLAALPVIYGVRRRYRKAIA
jgi:hypothetical protein